MGKAMTEASWIGKASYELGILTGQNGAWTFQRAKRHAGEIHRMGRTLVEFDPRATMRRLYAVNDNADAQPATFAGIDLHDIDIDVSGAPGAFTLLAIDSDQQTLERPTRLSIPHSLAHGVREALEGRLWYLDGVATARANGALIVVDLAKRPSTKAFLTLVLTRDEAIELRDLLASSAGRPHWSRFTARGFWHKLVSNGKAA